MLTEIVMKALMNDPEAIKVLFILDDLGCFNHLKPVEDISKRRMNVWHDDRPLWQIFDEMYAHPKNYKRR